ncbi:hypothetical protein [Streptomyces sp. NPDC002908]|uniref:hypothetical protein n=1 Tax=Streptomyces sp. NPDC002908 TaxID=3364670 RepID=UPI0036874FE7
MLIEGLMAAGGSAVVQAAPTDASNSVQGGFARLFGRGETARERAELECLDQTRAVLAAAGEGEEAQRVQIAQAEAARAAQSVQNDVARATFTNSQVLGSGNMTVTNNYDR